MESSKKSIIETQTWTNRERTIHRLYFEESLSQSEIGKNLGISRAHVSQIFRKRGWISRRKSKLKTRGEIETWLRTAQKRLNGVMDMKELDHRLNQFYLVVEIKSSPRYKKHRDSSKNFMQFIHLLSAGLTLSHVSKQLRLKYSHILRWYNWEKLPRLVRLTRSIPSKGLKEGEMWLSVKLKPSWDPVNLIRVPKRIKSYKNIIDVVKQLIPVESSDIQKSRARVDDIPLERSFMYLLGLIVSDGSFVKLKMPYGLIISLSSKYAWSRPLLEAVSSHLRFMGIATSSVKSINRQYSSKGERKNSKQLYIQSATSPLLNWIRNAVLGLEGKRSKSCSQIDAKWILKAPEKVRIAFIQGLFDGDGDVSLGPESVGITTTNKQKFYKSILETLGISSFTNNHGVRITKKQSILKSKNLPVFYYATSRYKLLEELWAMLKARSIRGRQRITDNEATLIYELHLNGFSLSKIKLELWKRLQSSRRRSTTKAAIKRFQKR